MPTQALARDALMPRTTGGNGRGIGLSMLVHAGLIVAIAFGVSWRSRTPEAQQAELWAAVPQAAAPRAAEPEPVVAPKPVPPPAAQPEPKVAPPLPPTPAPAPVPDAQIAIEKARVEKLRKEAAEREREAQRKKLLADQLAAERLAADKLRQQQLAAKQKELDAQKEAQQKKQQAAEERQAQQREADRKKNLERMMGQAGATGDAAARGSALQSAGPSASYAGRIIALLVPLSRFGDIVAGNPKAEVEIRVAPDGTITGRRLVKSSGVPAWDEAVLRAIDKAGALPRDTDGRVQNPTLIVWGPKD